jgi:hypothetical protein
MSIQAVESPAQELARLRTENDILKRAKAGKISFKVSTKQAISAYGLGRFPVTLYKQQWLNLFERIDDLRAFMVAHNSELAVKS